MMIRRGVYLLALFVCHSVLWAQLPDPARFSNYIDTVDLKRMVTYLASSEMQGRRTGEPGQKMAAQYIADRFQELGLGAVNSDNFYQPFQLLLSSPHKRFLNIDGVGLKEGRDYFFEGEMEMAQVKELELIYLDPYSVNSVKAAEVKDKALAISREEGTLKSALKLQQESALIVYLLDDEQMDEYASRRGDRERQAYIRPLSKAPRQSGSFYLRKSLIQDWIDAQNGKSGKVTLPLAYQVSRAKKLVETENVLALIEGKDKEKVLVITAHYDHEGVQHGEIFHGADDNASGTAALMEIAEAFKKATHMGFVPDISILFVAFSAEENGLLGSFHYVHEPPLPLSHHMANLNMDMIGRVAPEYADFEEYVYVLGTNRNKSLKKLTEKVNSTHTHLALDYSLDEPEQIFKQSDQWPFAMNGIPALLYFNGVHDDYHQPSDTVDKINFNLLRKRASLVFFTAWELAYNTSTYLGKR